MKRLICAPLFVTSIIVLLAAVKAGSADLPKVSPDSHRSALKDSVKDTKNELAQLIDFMMTQGQDARFGENIAPVIGLPGARPTKGDNIRSRKVYKERGGLNCAVVYEESSDATEYGGKRPICIILEVSKRSSSETEGKFYRLSLDGQLEQVVHARGKIDENGKGVRGSAVNTAADINSPEVKKAFAAEMADVRQWLKQQKKAVAKKAPAVKTSPKQ